MICIPRLRVAASACLLALVSSCTSVTFRQQDLLFDFDGEADAVTFELEYLDVGPVDYEASFFGSSPESKETGRRRTAGKFVDRVSKGDPTFIAFMAMGDWDLADLADDDSLPEVGREFLTGINVLEARAYLGAQGKLNLYQKLQLPNISKGIAVLNEEIRKFAVERGFADNDKGAAPAPGSIRSFEARNDAILKADAESGFEWIRWADTGLEVHIPVCSEYALAMLKEGLSEANRTDADELKDGMLTFSQVVAATRDFRIEKDHTVLIFGDDNGDLHFSFKGGFLDTEPDHRPGFVQYLEEGGMTFPMIYAKDE